MNLDPHSTLELLFSDGTPMTNRESILEKADITIVGNDNVITLVYDSEEAAIANLQSPGFHLLVMGNHNRVHLDNLVVGFYPVFGINGANMMIGGIPDDWLNPNEPRTVDNCTLTIGRHTKINGATIYLQDPNSSISIGEESMISWGIDIWCTDVHTILNDKKEPTNPGHTIEIGHHVWIGKDVKIGKNTKVSDHSVVGWGSIVTKKFETPYTLIAGSPAKVLKENIDWNPRCIGNYEQFVLGVEPGTYK